MNTDTIVMHYIRPTPDGNTTMTLCGCRIITDYQATAEAKSTGNWVTCPMCELAKTLEDMGLETETPEPEPVHRRMKPRRPTGWTQPAMF